MDTGQILAGRDQYVTHPPASTIKVLLALVVLDELPLDATVVADEADAKVECNCAGVKAGHTYTTQELLDGLLLVSGNDAANTLAHMLGGTDVAVAKMNAKAAALGATGTRAGSPSGLDGPGIDGYTTPHDLAVDLPRGAGQPGVRRDHVVPDRAVPRRRRTGDAGQPGRDAGPLPGHARRQDRFHRPRPQDVRRRRRSATVDAWWSR